MNNRTDSTLTRTRKRMAYRVARHAEAETVRQERKRASEARGAVLRYREALYLAEMADLAAEA